MTVTKEEEEAVGTLVLLAYGKNKSLKKGKSPRLGGVSRGEESDDSKEPTRNVASVMTG